MAWNCLKIALKCLKRPRLITQEEVGCLHTEESPEMPVHKIAVHNFGAS